ncbi:MAG: hypothetical protein ABI072_00740 [Edaphobacter sp.]
MNIVEFLNQAIPAALSAQVREAFKLLESLDKIDWPTVPATGDIFEHFR